MKCIERYVGEIIAPAVFVELASLEPGKDPGTEELALKARFEARVVVDGTVEDSSVVVRSLAAEIARVVNKNTWTWKMFQQVNLYVLNKT